MDNIKLSKGFVTIKMAGNETKELPGYNFEYEGLSLTVHKDHHNGLFWNVTENNTGMGLVMSKMSRKSALIDLKLFVNRIGPERIKEKIENMVGKKIFA